MRNVCIEDLISAVSHIEGMVHIVSFQKIRTDKILKDDVRFRTNI